VSRQASNISAFSMWPASAHDHLKTGVLKPPTVCPIFDENARANRCQKQSPFRKWLDAWLLKTRRADGF
jgi:hypothetical protein